MALIEIGKWDNLEGSLGKRGTGKSTHQCVRAMELSIDAGGAYVLGHSIGGRLPGKLPEEYGGHVCPIVYHDTIDKLARGIKRHPGQWHILAPPISTDPNSIRETADDLIKFAISLSRAVRKKAWDKKYPFGMKKPNGGWQFTWSDSVSHEGIQATPIILIIDEGIAIEAAGPSRKDSNRWFLEFLYSLRHMHIALLYAIQDASARSWRILEQATTLFVFRVSHDWALQSIAAAGASQEQIEEVRTAYRYHFVTLDLRAPIEGDERDVVLNPSEVPNSIRRAHPNPAMVAELQRIEAKTPEGTPA